MLMGERKGVGIAFTDRLDFEHLQLRTEPLGRKEGVTLHSRGELVPVKGVERLVKCRDNLPDGIEMSREGRQVAIAGKKSTSLSRNCEE